MLVSRCTSCKCRGVRSGQGSATGGSLPRPLSGGRQQTAPSKTSAWVDAGPSTWFTAKSIGSRLSGSKTETRPARQPERAHDSSSAPVSSRDTSDPEGCQNWCGLQAAGLMRRCRTLA